MASNIIDKSADNLGFLECPFCNSLQIQAEFDAEFDFFYCHCENCGARGPISVESDSAIDKYNARF